MLPVNIDSMAALEKINLSHNSLEHLPIAMGNLPKLRYWFVLFFAAKLLYNQDLTILIFVIVSGIQLENCEICL